MSQKMYLQTIKFKIGRPDFEMFLFYIFVVVIHTADTGILFQWPFRPTFNKEKITLDLQNSV